MKSAARKDAWQHVGPVIILAAFVAGSECYAAEPPAAMARREVGELLVTAKWVEIPTDPQRAADLRHELGQVFTGPQFQVIMRALSQKKHVDLFSSPRVTTGFGQPVTLRTWAPITVPVEFVPEVPAVENLFLGARLEVLVHRQENQSFKLCLDADYAELQFCPLPWRRPGMGMIETARRTHLRKSKTILLRNGEACVFDMGNSPLRPDRVVLCFVTVSLSDPTAP